MAFNNDLLNESELVGEGATSTIRIQSDPKGVETQTILIIVTVGVGLLGCILGAAYIYVRK